MTEPFHFVDVLVGKIYSAGEGCVSVDNKDLAMVAVV